MSADGPSADSGRPALRFLITVLVFAVVGLAIGLVVAILGYILFAFDIVFNTVALGMYALTAYGLSLAYPLYLLPAMGVYAALRDRFGGVFLIEAALLSALLAVLWAEFLASANMPVLASAAVIASTVVATIVSCMLTRWLRRYV